MLKVWCSEIGDYIADENVQIFGGAGYVEDYPAERYWRDASFRVEDLTTPGQGRHDTFDSLEKAKWRKFRDAVDFIDPRRGETLLDVGCGYGGQLVVALELHPFGKVVGCTHSQNQCVFGRQLLAAFDPGLWELRQADYRESGSRSRRRLGPATGR